MKELYDLKDMLCKQLEDYGKKGELSAAVLERVDMLAHAVKNLDKVIEDYEAEASGGYSNGDTSYNDYRDRSMRRDSMGRYSRRYSRNGGMSEKLREIMEDVPDERSRQKIQRLISEMDQM